MTQSRRLAISHIIGLSLLHIALFYYFPAQRFTWASIACGFFMYQIKILGITVGYHRLYTHRSFNAHPALKFVFALMGTMAGQGPISRWVNHHWEHHRHSDTHQDPHSPVSRSFFYAHLGWLFNPESFDDQKIRKQKLNLGKAIQFLDDHFTLCFLLQAPFLYYLGHITEGNGWTWVYTGFVAATVLSLHSTFLVNSLCHVLGKKDYVTTDESRNNLLVALLTNGEGWHNNHHAHPNSAIHGWNKGQLDISYLLIRFFEKLGLISNVKYPKL
jgi:stearoyl-CoA desaturase (Delta-9 desaturase)